jgi:glycosyltransferase involved in cell wall biosynthesis
MGKATGNDSCRAVRVLLIGDMRSPHTWGWVDAVRSAGIVILNPDGMPWPEHSNLGENRAGARTAARRWAKSVAGATQRRQRLIATVRRVAGPLLALVRGFRLRRVVRRVQPDIVHGMRIPHEALTALVACPSAVPLAISIWGSDLTYDASRSWVAGCAARQILARTDLLFADCRRDIELAGSWGLRPATRTAVLPGGGGIELAQAAASQIEWVAGLRGPGVRLVVNTRGRRPYVRNDVLLAALAMLADDLDPTVHMVFVNSAQDDELLRAIDRHPLVSRIHVTDKRAPGEVLALLRAAEVSVSITDRDGTPNSLLECMSTGAIPVYSDLPSIREWIENGKNGFLAAFDSSQEVAEALHGALALTEIERSALIQENLGIIARRAERRSAGRQAAEAYGSVLPGRQQTRRIAI